MGIIRNAANRKIRGRIGDTTYYVSMDRQIARQALNSSNYGESARRTEAQQNRRVRWANLVNFYKLSKSWMPKAFETKRSGQTDYNRFMSVNINNSTVALTKDQAITMACVVEPFIISQGSLPTIEITPVQNAWTTDIALGDLAIVDATPVSEFSKAVIGSNKHIKEGMQLSFVSYQQFVNNQGTPSVVCAFYEVTLNTTSTDRLRDYLPNFCSMSVGNCLGTSDQISIGAFAYIISDSSNGTIQVSSQTLINNNASLIEAFSSLDQFKKAVDSYGVDKEVVLSPISQVMQSPEKQPVGINSVFFKYAGKTFVDGDYVGNSGDMALSNPWSVNMSGMDGKTLLSLTIFNEQIPDGVSADLSKVSVVGNTIKVEEHAFNSGSWAVYPLLKVEVQLAGGEVYEINFRGGEEHE